MPFALWARMGSRNHVLDGVQIPPWEGTILGESGAHTKYKDTLRSPVRKRLNGLSYRLDCNLGMARGIMNYMGVQIPHEKGQFWGKGLPIVKYLDFLLIVSCAETAEPIDLPFGLLTRVGRRKHKFNH